MVDRSKYEEAAVLAEQGRYPEALGLMMDYLQASPRDVEALNDAGTILHCMGRCDEAVAHLLQAKRIDSQNPQILWNLIEAYIAANLPDRAEQMFDEAESLGLLNPEVLNRTANTFINQDNKSGAVEVLLRSLRLWPSQEILEHMLQVIKSKRPKIAFFVGADGGTFLDHICEFLKDRFEIQIFDGTTEQQLYELMEWSDISWFEWCTDLAVIGSNGPKVCENIIRLHRYEAYMDHPARVNWQNVDVLMTVGNSYVRQALLSVVPQIESSTSIVTIPNGVDLEKIKLIERQRGKNIAYIGYMNMRKNIPFLLQCMQKLRYIDPEYKLFIAGSFQDGTLEQYVKYSVKTLGLEDGVFFDGWQSDIEQWLWDKHYIVSASVGESQGMGLQEAMAAGLKPVVHSFPGAEEIYPREYIFDIAEQFCEHITGGEYEPAGYRKYIEQNYSQKQQLGRINELLISMEARIDSKKPAGAVASI